MILTSLGSKSGTPFYLNHQNRVNTILTHFLRLPRHAKPDVVRPLPSEMQQRARAVVRSRLRPIAHPPVADRENLRSGERCYGLGGGVGRGLGLCAGLGVGVGLGEGVAVAVAVALACGCRRGCRRSCGVVL